MEISTQRAYSISFDWMKITNRIWISPFEISDMKSMYVQLNQDALTFYTVEDHSPLWANELPIPRVTQNHLLQ